MNVTEIARAESERGELVLRQRCTDAAPAVLELRANGLFVMDSAETSTEIALATTTLERVDHPRRVLIGGLGLGYTLGAVLADSRVEHVAVVEIEESLIGWMRDGTIPHGPALLADERVQIVDADLALAVAEARHTYDLVLLDVDNGPEHLVHRANSALYQAPFLHRVRDLLSPGGLLSVWSMDSAEELQVVMAQVFDELAVVPVSVRLQGRDEQYWLIIGSVSTP